MGEGPAADSYQRHIARDRDKDEDERLAELLNGFDETTWLAPAMAAEKLLCRDRHVGERCHICEKWMKGIFWACTHPKCLAQQPDGRPNKGFKMCKCCFVNMLMLERIEQTPF